MNLSLGQVMTFTQIGLAVYLLVNDKNMSAKILSGLVIVNALDDLTKLGILKV